MAFPLRTLSLAAAAASTLAVGVVSVAQAEGEVNVYTDRQPFLIDPLIEAFTEETGIKVNVVYATSGIEERLKAEGQNSPADLVMTVDVGRLVEMVKDGLAQPVNSDVLNANIPADFRADDNSWFGLTFRARLLYTSIDRVAEGEITRYEDLADPKWRGRICTRPGDHDYNLGLLASMIAHHGEEEARAWADAVRQNLAQKPQGNDRQQVRFVMEGLCDIAITNSYYMGAMVNDEEQRNWVAATRLVFPNQEDYGTHINVSGVLMTAHAPNRDSALRLMEFLSDDRAQAMYSEGNTEYPVKPGVAWSELIQSWGTHSFDSASLEAIGNHKPQALRIMNEVGYNDGP